MIINIDTDYIMSLYDCDFDMAASILAELDDKQDTLLDKLDDAIVNILNDAWFLNDDWDSSEVDYSKRKMSEV